MCAEDPEPGGHCHLDGGHLEGGEQPWRQMRDPRSCARISARQDRSCAPSRSARCTGRRHCPALLAMSGPLQRPGPSGGRRPAPSRYVYSSLR
jgi:hypothetical protein